MASSTFQARHYNAIAENLHNTRTRMNDTERDALDNAATALAYMFGADNQRFDIQRFLHVVKEGK